MNPLLAALNRATANKSAPPSARVDRVDDSERSQVRQELEQDLQQAQQQAQQQVRSSREERPWFLGKTSVLLGKQQQQRFQGQGRIRRVGAGAVGRVARQAPSMERGELVLIDGWLAVTMGSLGRVMIMDTRYPLVRGQVLPPYTRRVERYRWRRVQQQGQRVKQVRGPIHNYAYLALDPRPEKVRELLEEALANEALPQRAYRIVGPYGVVQGQFPEQRSGEGAQE